MDAVAREVCMAAGSGVIMVRDGAERILGLLRDHLAPDAADCKFFRESSAPARREARRARRGLRISAYLEAVRFFATRPGLPGNGRRFRAI